MEITQNPLILEGPPPDCGLVYQFAFQARYSGMIRTQPIAEHIIAATEESLRNLQREVIDLQQLHVWHDAWLASGSFPRRWSASTRHARPQ